MFAEDLARATWACVHFVPEAEVDRAALRAALDKLGILTFEVDASQVVTEGQLLDALAREMRFPGYFGHNWDALDECLRDMDWLPASGYVMLVRGAEQLWQRATRVAGSLVESWLFVAEEWSRDGKPFHLVFVW